MAGLQSTPIVDRAPLAERFEMGDTSLGRHDDASTGDVRPPAQVEILAVERDLGIETAEGLEQISTHERRRALHEEHIADGVELLLVEIASFDVGGGLPVAVGADTHGEQPPMVAPLDDLRADDPGVGAEGFLDEETHGIGFETHVVVADQMERRTLDRDQRLVRSGGETRVGVESAQMRVGQHPHHPLADLGTIGAGGIDEKRGELRIILRGDTRERLLEPPAGIVDHHDHHHRRGGGGVIRRHGRGDLHSHDEARG